MACPLRLRPPLRLQSLMSVEEIVARLRQKLASDTTTVTATIVDGYVVLRVPEDQRHYWSPQLSLTLESEGTGTSVHGLFMPHPSVWTLFVWMYAVIVFAGFSGGIYGFAQRHLDQPAHALWSIPAALILIFLVYSAASMGQHLGRDQMEELRDIVLEALDTPPPE